MAVQALIIIIIIITITITMIRHSLGILPKFFFGNPLCRRLIPA